MSFNPTTHRPGFYRARLADEITLRKKIRENLAAELGPPPGRLRRPIMRKSIRARVSTAMSRLGVFAACWDSS